MAMKRLDPKERPLMEGDVLVLASGSAEVRLRVSKVDGAVVKLFDEAGVYRQMALSDVDRLLEEGHVTFAGEANRK